MKETFEIESIGAATETPHSFIENNLENEALELDKFRGISGIVGKVARALALSSMLLASMPQDGYGKNIQEAKGAKDSGEQSFSKYENFSFKHGSFTFIFNSKHEIDNVDMRGYKTGVTRQMLEKTLLKDDWTEKISGDKGSLEAEPSFILQTISAQLRVIDMYKDGYDELVSKKGEDSEESMYLKKVLSQTISGIENQYGSIFKEDLF